MTYTNYTSINSLEEFSIIAGNDFLLEFTVYQDDGVNLLDISAATIKWVLSPFGQPSFTALQKTGTITGVGTFSVALLSADTASLSGKYIQQPIVDSGGVIYRPAQGCVFIQPQIVST